mmetsp:Transcript_23573/g.54050  ORF Transcript_23573/g.54050 Transcript_23573/m.54050 type:complete len:98 (+) Transcript_23573:453-746(+)
MRQRKLRKGVAVSCDACRAVLLRCCFCRTNHIETYHRTEIAAAELGALIGVDLHEANDSNNRTTFDDDAGGSFDFETDQEAGGSAQGDGPRETQPRN